jgi:WD40 repeat protein
MVHTPHYETIRQVKERGRDSTAAIKFMLQRLSQAMSVAVHQTFVRVAFSRKVSMEQRSLSATIFPTSPGKADRTSNVKLTIFPDHAGPVPSVSWSVRSPGEDFFLAAPSGPLVRIWRIPSGSEVFTYMGHTQTVRTAVFSPLEQQWIASLGEDLSLQVWTFAPQTHNHSSLQYRLDHPAESLAWSNNGRLLLLAGSQRQQVFEHEYSGAPPLLFAPFHLSSTTYVAWSPDGSTVVSTDQEGRTAIWSARSRTVRYWHQMTVTALAWSPRGSYLATAVPQSDVLVWKPGNERLQEIALYERHTGNVQALAWSPDQQYIVTGDEKGIIDIWNAVTARPMLSLSLRSPILALAWSPDGKFIAVGTQSLPLFLIHVPQIPRSRNRAGGVSDHIEYQIEKLRGNSFWLSG